MAQQAGHMTTSFACGMCGRCFRLADECMEHIRGHTANKHFRCLVCWPLFSDITDSEPPPSRGISQALASDVQPQPTTDGRQHSGCNNCGDCHSCSTGYEGKTQLVKDDWDTQAHELSVTMQIESCQQTPPQFSLENGERLILDKHSTNLACDTDMDSSDGSAAGGQKKGQPKRMVHTELTKISHDELTRSAHDELTGAIHDELTASTRDKLVASTGDKLVTSPCDLSASTGDKLGCVPVSNWSSTIPSVDDKEQWCSRHGELTETHDTVNDRETITNNKDTVTNDGNTTSNDGEPTTNDKGITINDIDTTATTTVQQVEVSGDVADKVADLVSMQDEVCDLHSVAQSLLSLAQEELPPSRSNTDGESKETGAGSEDSVRCGTGTVPGESSQSSADGTPPVIRVKTSSKGPNFTNVIKFLKYVSVRKGITPTQNIQTDHSDVVEKCLELQTGTENLAAGRGDGESPSNPHATILRKLVCSGQNAAQSCEENPRVRAILYVPASLQPPAEMGTGSWELHSETTVRIESQETDSVSVRTVPQGTGHTVCQTAANADGDDSVRHTGTNNKDSGGESSQHASQDDDGADDDTGHRDETSSIGVRDPASVDDDKDGQRSSLLCSGLNQVGDSIGGPISSGCVSSNASHSVSVPDHDYSTVHRDFRRNSVHGYTALRSNTETNSAQKGVALQAETLTEAEMEKERMLQCVDLYPRKKKNPEPSSTSGAAATCLQARPDENTNTKRTTKSSGAKRGTRRKGQPSKRKKDQRQTGVTDSAGVPTVDHRQDPSTLTVHGSSSVCGTSVENLTNTGSTSQHPDTQAVLKSNQPVHIPEASAEDNQPAGCRENTEILSTLAEPAVADSVITGCGQTDSLAVEHAVGSGQDRKAMDVVILPTHFDSADQAKGVNSDTGGGRREVEQSAVVNTVEDTSAADVDDLSASAGSFDVPVKDVPARDSRQPDNREPVTHDREPVVLDREPVVLDREPVVLDREPVTLDREPVTDKGHDPSRSHREREGQRHVVVTRLPSRLTGKGSTRKRQADESLVAMSVGQILLSDIQSASKRRLRSSMTHVNPHQPSKPDRASSERTGPKGKVTDTVSACETTTVIHSSSQKEELAQLELENEGPLCLTLRHSHQQETLSSTRLSTSTPQTKEQRRLKVKLPFMDRKSGSGKKQVKKSGFSEEKSHSSRGEERQVLSLSKSQTIENRQSLRHRSSVSPDPCSNRGHVKSELMRLGENMALDVLAEIGCANDTVVEGTGENKTDISRADVLYRRDNPLREDLSDTRAVSIGDNRHYDCKKCGAQFRHKLSLMSHMTVHQSIGSDCVCDVCGRTFTRPYSVKIHRMIHTKEASIDCKICGKTLANPVNLQIHMRIHTDERPYTCSECPKTFRQQAALYSHQRTHSKERPYACEYCGKSYAFQKNLYTHRFSHTGQRPYVCKICGAGFRQMTALNVHIRGHTGEKPFKCPECPSAFAQKSHLKKHVQHRHQPKVESAEKVAADKAKPYRCIQCDKGFCSPFSVRRHMNGYCTEDKNYVAHTKSHA